MTVIIRLECLNLTKQVTVLMLLMFQSPPIPVHREFVTQPGMVPAVSYPEHHLPTYSSVCPPVITHHSRQFPTSFRRGYDVCDSADDSHVANVR